MERWLDAPPHRRSASPMNRCAVAPLHRHRPRHQGTVTLTFVARASLVMPAVYNWNNAVWEVIAPHRDPLITNMSVRSRGPPSTGNDAAPGLQSIACSPNATLMMDVPQTRQQQAAASLEVSHEELKPISWLNDAHYTQLQKKNALDGQFVRRIEAYRAESNAAFQAA